MIDAAQRLLHSRKNMNLSELNYMDDLKWIESLKFFKIASK